MKELEEELKILIGSADGALNQTELLRFTKAMECLNNCIMEGKNSESSDINASVFKTSDGKLQSARTKHTPFRIR